MSLLSSAIRPCVAISGDLEQIATHAAEALAAGEALDPLRRATWGTVLDRYALDYCLPRQIRMVEEVAAEG